MRWSLKSYNTWVILVALLGIVLILLVGTTRRATVTEGYVVQTRHVLRTESPFNTPFRSFGRVFYLPIRRVVPESWQVLLSDGDRDTWVTVSEERFQCIQVGQYIDLRFPCSSVEEPSYENDGK